MKMTVTESKDPQIVRRTQSEAQSKPQQTTTDVRTRHWAEAQRRGSIQGTRCHPPTSRGGPT